MKKYWYRVIALGSLAISLGYLSPLSALAIEISRVSEVPVKNDILLKPAKVEIKMAKGDKTTTYIDIVNRMGEEGIFEIGVEDFSPATDPDGGVILDKSIDGLNSSLKRYIKIERLSFTLSHGEQARIPVIIDLPTDINTNGLYGVVLVSGSPLKNKQGTTRVITRLGSLFFVKVDGYSKQAGVFKGAFLKNNKIEILFENGGDIYLNPYGIISIRQAGGSKIVKKIEIDPWFVLPRSIRSRSIGVGDLPAGKYVATISLNRGYADIVDNKELTFELDGVSNSKYKASILFGFIVVSGIFLYKRYIYDKKKS